MRIENKEATVALRTMASIFVNHEPKNFVISTDWLPGPDSNQRQGG